MLNYCDKNSRELQTVNLMAAAQCAGDICPGDNQHRRRSSPTSGRVPGEVPGAEAKSKTGSTVNGASLQPGESKSAVAGERIEISRKETSTKTGARQVEAV